MVWYGMDSTVVYGKKHTPGKSTQSCVRTVFTFDSYSFFCFSLFLSEKKEKLFEYLIEQIFLHPYRPYHIHTHTHTLLLFITTTKIMKTALPYTIHAQDSLLPFSFSFYVKKRRKNKDKRYRWHIDTLYLLTTSLSFFFFLKRKEKRNVNDQGKYTTCAIYIYIYSVFLRLSLSSHLLDSISISYHPVRDGR